MAQSTDPQISILENGLTVVSQTMPHLETASVGVWVGVGARHEVPAIQGIFHMLEHMAFKGTERRSALQIAEEIEAVGGHLNAYTGREQTAYYARVLKDDLPLAIDILSDILQNSTFEDQEFERERQVVIQEIGQSLDTPDDVVFEQLQAIAYPDQPLGRGILGTVDTVSAFNRDDLVTQIGKHYRAPQMVLAAAGSVSHEKLVDMARGAFGNLQEEPASGAAGAQYAGGSAHETRELEQVHLALGFEGVPYDHPDFYAAQVYSGVLGGGMSSRLFQEARERRGLCYSIFSFASAYRDSGFMGVYAGTSPGQVNELSDVIAAEMSRMALDADDTEIARARAQLKAGLLMSLESSGSRVEQMASQLLSLGRVIPIEELVSRVEAVSTADVRQFAKKLLAGSKPSVSTIGPESPLENGEIFAAKFAS